METQIDVSGSDRVPSKWTIAILATLLAGAVAAIIGVIQAVYAKSDFIGILAAGALGGLLHSLRSFWWYVGNRELRWSWVPMYICLPFTGASLALLVCLLVRAGAIKSDPQVSNDSIYYTLGLAGLVGLFSELAIWKLRQLAAAIFGEPPAGKDTVKDLDVEAVTPNEAKADAVIAQCEANWDASKDDCNKFVKAVADKLNVKDIPGNANADGIVAYLQDASEWRKLAAGDDFAAKQAADAGKFVIGGLTSAELGDANGHVVVVVAGPFDPGHGRYPRAYWGQLHGVGKKNTTVNYAFKRPYSDRIRYFVKDL